MDFSFEDICPDVTIVEGDLPDECHLVRRLGCPVTRQFDVYEMGYSLFIVEVPTDKNPKPGKKVAVVGMRQLLNTTAARLLKANDGTLEGHRLAGLVNTPETHTLEE